MTGLLLAGMIIGLLNITPENSHLFGVLVLLLISIAIIHQWTMKQLTVVAGFMVNAERVMEFRHLETEK